jgi:hypothetical protein
MAYAGPATKSIGLSAPHVASAIAGHHAGMPDVGHLRDKATAKEKCAEAFALLERAANDLPRLGQLLAGPPKLEKVGTQPFRPFLPACSLAVWSTPIARILQAAKPPKVPLGAANRLATLLDYLSELATKSPEGTVKKAP